MSNFSENNDLNNTNENIKDNKDKQQDDFSTVFSDPTQHKKEAPVKVKKSRLPIIIASVLAVAVLVGGTIAIVKFIPEKEKNTSSDAIKEIKVLDLDNNDFKTVSVTNKNGTFKFYSEKEESTSSDSSSKSTTTKNWYLEGYDKDIIDSSSLSGITSSVAKISASREITSKTSSECGFDSPSVTIKVVTDKDAEFSVLVGGESPDKSGYYLMLPETKKIYLVESTVSDTFDFDLLKLADKTSIPGINSTDELKSYMSDDGKLSTFDSMTVTGKNFPEKLVLIQNDNKDLSQYATFVTTSPTKRIADNVDVLINLFKDGLSVNGAYALDTSSASITKLGLNNPDMCIEIKLGKYSGFYKFKLQEDGSYAVLSDKSRIIKKVDASSLSFIDYKVNNFYASWVCLQSINDLSNFTIKTADKTYSFDIVYDSDENAKEKYVITYEGKKLVAENFQNFYQYCISLSCADYTVGSLNSQPDLSIIFTYTDTSKGKTTVSFRKSSETKYQYNVDGVEMGKINSSDFKKITEYVEKVADGKDIK